MKSQKGSMAWQESKIKIKKMNTIGFHFPHLECTAGIETLEERKRKVKRPFKMWILDNLAQLSPLVLRDRVH